MKNVNRFIVRPLVFILMAAAVCVSVLPLIWTLLSSFKTNLEIFGSPLTLPTKLSFSSYKYVFEMSPVFKFLWNSVVTCLGAVLLNVLTVGMAAYVVARRNFRFKTLFVTLVSLVLFVPSMCSLFTIYMLYTRVGLIDTKIGLILMYAGSGSIAFTFFTMRAGFMAIPRELEEAAYIDGAGFFRTFIQVMLPLVRSNALVAGIMMFLSCWNNYLTPLTFTTTADSRPLSVMLNYFVSQFATNYSSMFAAIIIAVIPSIIIFLLLSNKIVKGVSEGGVKG